MLNQLDYILYVDQIFAIRKHTLILGITKPNPRSENNEFDVSERKKPDDKKIRYCKYSGDAGGIYQIISSKKEDPSPFDHTKLLIILKER